MIVALSGLANAGKDFVADILCREHGFTKICLADPIKQICMDVFDWKSDRLWGPSAMRNEPDPRYDGLTARFALQRLGTEWARACYPNVWVDYLIRSCQRLRYQEGPTLRIVVPDVRFKNEIEALRKASAVLVRIVRIGDTAQWDHASETEQLEVPDDAFDYGLQAESGDLDWLTQQTHKLAGALGLQKKD